MQWWHNYKAFTFSMTNDPLQKDYNIMHNMHIMHTEPIYTFRSYF